MTEKLKEYFDLLSKWNRSIKLVSRADDFDQFVFEHVEDALRACEHLKGASSLLDIGTGAGIPGILIKMQIPSLRVVLLDSIRKKVSFCEEAIRKLGLEGIEALPGRAEDEAVIEALGRFDAIVSRATWKVGEYLPMAVPYMGAEGSRIIAMKGPAWRDEIAEAEAFMVERGLKLIAADEYKQADGRGRCLLVISS
jgi:16S rRNA (guanine527-N7)-methyltransferase